MKEYLLWLVSKQDPGNTCEQSKKQIYHLKPKSLEYSNAYLLQNAEGSKF